ncbi:hypothetical protein M408DRAFT_331658 [Serendipita vermifera MAFF 305830]|uniref:Calponin-homology (CH) domain-containing protein n=1 Tax=Serendipita vermifera MAFF 305830 TaxID=933852 RepID=A0A0C2X5X7_SERVB|nr:hypothetical protein M408DRAFT_331658 [Serendipita vermifera MAFF 305830]
MGESRTELLQWLNDLLSLNYTKIEQCGTGAAYCQIFDSIYGDLPLTRVKFNAKQEYESLANFKILQNVFKAKKIDKPILVEKLTKCKMQDNLEFLQWCKRFWDQNYSGQQYDAVARRKGQAADPPATLAPVGGAAFARTATSPSGSGPRGKTPIGGSRVTQNNVEVLTLQTQLSDMTTQMEGLEKERDFYFAKLRDIEILVQQELESPDHQEGKEDEVLKEIQKILYSTEEGFEVPEAVPEDETF